MILREFPSYQSIRGEFPFVAPVTSATGTMVGTHTRRNIHAPRTFVWCNYVLCVSWFVSHSDFLLVENTTFDRVWQLCGTGCAAPCANVSVRKCHETVWHCTDSHCKRTSSSSRVDEKRAESWNKVFWIQCVIVGFVVPVLAGNPLAYSCLCPISLQLLLLSHYQKPRSQWGGWWDYRRDYMTMTWIKVYHVV